MYIEISSAFGPNKFQNFCNLIGDSTHLMVLEVVPDLNTHVEYFSYFIANHIYPVHWINDETGCESPIGHENFQSILSWVKAQCLEVVEMLILELDHRFPQLELMTTVGIVFPEHWLRSDCHDQFSFHLSILKSHFCQSKSTKDNII